MGFRDYSTALADGHQDYLIFDEFCEAINERIAAVGQSLPAGPAFEGMVMNPGGGSAPWTGWHGIKWGEIQAWIDTYCHLFVKTKVRSGSGPWTYPDANYDGADAIDMWDASSLGDYVYWCATGEMSPATVGWRRRDATGYFDVGYFAVGDVYDIHLFQDLVAALKVLTATKVEILWDRDTRCASGQHYHIILATAKANAEAAYACDPWAGDPGTTPPAAWSDLMKIDVPYSAELYHSSAAVFIDDLTDEVAASVDWYVEPTAYGTYSAHGDSVPPILDKLNKLGTSTSKSAAATEVTGPTLGGIGQPTWPAGAPPPALGKGYKYVENAGQAVVNWTFEYD